MKSRATISLLNEIETAINNIKSLGVISKIEESYLTKFLIVFTSGIYEQIIENILSEWALAKCHPQIAHFIIRYINNKFRNPDIENIVRVLSEFNKDWADEIEKLPNANKSALDTIVSNKNAIAHGTLSIINLTKFEDLYNASKKVIEKIDNIVL